MALASPIVSRLDEVVGDVLASAGAGFASSFRALRTAPWNTNFPQGSLVAFHVVQDGMCRATVGSNSFPLVRGEVVLFPHGTAHRLGSDHEAADSASLICGGYWLDRRTSHPLFASLPSVIRIAWSNGDHVELAAVIELMQREVALGAQSSNAVMRRLIELLVIYAVRAWVASTRLEPDGWTAALRDPQIGLALEAIHREPERNWNVAALAKLASMARATFARRFATLVGRSPYAYVVACRIDRAARLLRATDQSVAAVARTVGYDSEFAFSRRFRSVKGLSPRAYRATIQRA